MLLSMTGFGESRHQSDDLTLSVEVRAVNNRHLKVTVRGSEPYPMLEPELEKVVRKYIRRGTILVHVRCDRNYRPQDFRINEVALRPTSSRFTKFVRISVGVIALITCSAKYWLCPAWRPSPASWEDRPIPKWALSNKHLKTPSKASTGCVGKKVGRWATN